MRHLEFVKRTKRGRDGVGQIARRRSPSPLRRRRKVLPEEVVVQVPAAVELDRCLLLDHLSDVAIGNRLAQPAGNESQRARISSQECVGTDSTLRLPAASLVWRWRALVKVWQAVEVRASKQTHACSAALSPLTYAWWCLV